jgi:hypothetical protein
MGLNRHFNQNESMASSGARQIAMSSAITSVEMPAVELAEHVVIAERARYD